MKPAVHHLHFFLFLPFFPLVFFPFVFLLGCESPRLTSQRCTTASDCQEGLVCLDGTCTFCRSDNDCVLPMRCGAAQAGYCDCADVDGDGTTCDDCNDNDPTIFPGGAEVCDGKDNDCDGLIDEEVVTRYFADQDLDGFGSPSLYLDLCKAPPGFVTSGTDCNDADPTAHPGAIEVCDGRDNDCNGLLDEEVKRTYYRDADGDGFGDQRNTLASCLVPAAGYVETFGDCDDTRADVNPSAEETCNARDDDCDGVVDGLSRACDNLCGAGVEQCDRGGWVGCTAPVTTTIAVPTTLTGARASYDCLMVTANGRLTVGPEMALEIRHWLKVEKTGVLELGPRASITAAEDLLFVEQATLLASEATFTAGRSIQVDQGATWFAQATKSTPYSGGGSAACASATQAGVSGAGGGARGGAGGQGGTCGSSVTQPRPGVGGPGAVNGANGASCPADATSPGGAPSGGAGGAPLAGGGGGANGGPGGAGADGLYQGIVFDGGPGGLAEDSVGLPLYGGGGGGSAGTAQVSYLPEACLGRGGAGGGIVRVRAPRFVNKGLLYADGEPSPSTAGVYANGGGGGGGAGGTWLFLVDSFENLGSISAAGANGGAGSCIVLGSRCGGGGGGGGGRVVVAAPDGGAPVSSLLGNIFVGGGSGGAGAGAGSTPGSPGQAGSAPIGSR